MWKRVTSVEKEEQGIVVLLDSLEGNRKAEKATANFTDTDLFCADGLQKLIEVFTLPILAMPLLTFPKLTTLILIKKSVFYEKNFIK